MNTKTFYTFLIKLSILFLPFIFLTTIFIVKDPFKIIKTYKEYNEYPLCLNQGYICWQNYLNNKDSLNYNSFLFGNSCSMAYKMGDWEKHIEGGKAISLMGSGESLYSIHAKLLRLENMKIPVKNILILLDYNTLKDVTPPTKHTFILHNNISGSSKFNIQLCFLQAFLKPSVFIAYFDYSIFRKHRAYMCGIIGEKRLLRNPITNDLNNPREIEILRDSTDYYNRRNKEFPDPIAIEDNTSIGTKQIVILKDIKRILDKFGSRNKIVINPNYLQYKMNHIDLKNIQKIFNKENVFDFSGTNKYSTNKSYFYDRSHYRPVLGRKILEEIYK